MSLEPTPGEYAGLIFDCDGTLADTMPLHFMAWRQTMTAHGVEFGEDRFYAMAGQPTVKIVEILLAEQQRPGDPCQIAHEKETAFLELLPQVKPVEPVMEVARAFRNRLPMGVGSGSNRAVVLQILERLQVADWFDAVVGAEDTARHKPEPDVFLEVARRIGVPPEACLVYEDADLGVQAAERAGMGCFDIRQVYQPPRVSFSAE